MSLKVNYIGWDAVLLETSKGTRVIIDPLFNGNPEYAVPKTPAKLDDIVPVDIVLASHIAGEHLGQGFDIVKKCKAKLICMQDVRQSALKADVPDDQIIAVVSGATIKIKDITIKILNARHISFSAKYGTGGEAFCFIVKDEEGHVIFHGADTSLTSDMKLWAELYRPNIAFIGVGGPIINGHMVAELDPWDASVAADMLGVDIAIPMHWLTKPEAEEFKKIMAERCPLTKVKVLDWNSNTVL